MNFKITTLQKIFAISCIAFLCAGCVTTTPDSAEFTSQRAPPEEVVIGDIYSQLSTRESPSSLKCHDIFAIVTNTRDSPLENGKVVFEQNGPIDKPDARVSSYKSMQAVHMDPRETKIFGPVGICEYTIGVYDITVSVTEDTTTLGSRTQRITLT